mgnify:CR=1 FL=1
MLYFFIYYIIEQIFETGSIFFNFKTKETPQKKESHSDKCYSVVIKKSIFCIICTKNIFYENDNLQRK